MPFESYMGQASLSTLFGTPRVHIDNSIFVCFDVHLKVMFTSYERIYSMYCSLFLGIESPDISVSV